MLLQGDNDDNLVVTVYENDEKIDANLIEESFAEWN